MPLGSGALAGLNWDIDRDAVAAELGFDARRRELDRRRLQPRLRPRLPRPRPSICATHLSRLGAEIVLWSSERVRLLRAGRGLLLGLVDHAAEEEPRRGRAAAGEGARGCWPRYATLAGVAARPAARLRQGPAGGQGAAVRRRRHDRALPRGARRDAAGHRASTASGWPRPPPTRCSPRPTSPTCWSAAGCRSARPTASSAGWSAHALDAGHRPLRDLRRAARRLLRAARRRVLRGAAPRARGWTRSSRAAAPRPPPSPRQLELARGEPRRRLGGVSGARSEPPLGAGVLRPLGPRRSPAT